MSPRIILSILFIIFLNHNTQTFRRHWSEIGVKGWRIQCFAGFAAVRFRRLIPQTRDQLRSQEFTEIINGVWNAHKFWRVHRTIKIFLANYFFFNNYDVPRVDNLFIWTKILVMFFTASKPTVILYPWQVPWKYSAFFVPIELHRKGYF